MSRLEGDSNSKLRIHTECSNHLNYQGQTFAVPFFYAGSGGIDISDFLCLETRNSTPNEPHVNRFVIVA